VPGTTSRTVPVTVETSAGRSRPVSLRRSRTPPGRLPRPRRRPARRRGGREEERLCGGGRQRYGGRVAGEGDLGRGGSPALGDAGGPGGAGSVQQVSSRVRGAPREPARLYFRSRAARGVLRAGAGSDRGPRAHPRGRLRPHGRGQRGDLRRRGRLVLAASATEIAVVVPPGRQPRPRRSPRWWCRREARLDGSAFPSSARRGTWVPALRGALGEGGVKGQARSARRSPGPAPLLEDESRVGRGARAAGGRGLNAAATRPRRPAGDVRGPRAAGGRGGPRRRPRPPWCEGDAAGRRGLRDPPGLPVRGAPPTPIAAGPALRRHSSTTRSSWGRARQAHGLGRRRGPRRARPSPSSARRSPGSTAAGCRARGSSACRATSSGGSRGGVQVP